jgi:hypothetical protein
VTKSHLRAIPAFILLLATRLHADTVTFVEGETKSGCIWGVEQEAIVLSTQPVPGLPAVNLRIPKTRVAAIAFSPDEQREAFLRMATQEHLPELAKLWSRFAPFLSLRGSPAARIGLRYGVLSLELGSAKDSEELLLLFQKIASGAPTSEEQEAAKQGILRALVRSGHWGRAESEAAAFTKTACSVSLLAEARLTVGIVQKKRLQEFVMENPRWNLDEFVRPERDRLYHAALDSLLAAALLPGAPGELAARARLCAMEVCDAAGERHRSASLAEDIIAFHLGTSEARTAQEWLQTHRIMADSKPK